ncbi:hypothetical protein FB192DRAFT_1392267 [Mucor lusitanicus]|nr:hypothetical protein FB192DRAFT_1392267 [Mucor lusitanicus]
MKAWYVVYTMKQSLKAQECVFNDFLVFPYTKCLALVVRETIEDCHAEFVVGETPLEAMKKQLDEEDGSSLCFADVVIKLFGLKEAEVVLLDTSSHFGCTDNGKISFDHHKGLFGTLAMLKSIADSYYFGKVETFAKIKVLFLQAAGHRVYAWSMRYVEDGPAYELWLEDVLDIHVKFEEREEMLPRAVSFWWLLKELVAETTKQIMMLRDEHSEELRKHRFSPSPSTNLADQINPSILKLTEEDDKTGLHKIGPFYHK